MITRVSIKNIEIIGDGIKPDEDQRRLSGTVLIGIETEYGPMEVGIPFSNAQLLNDVAIKALERFGRLVTDIDQAVRLAKAEYVFSGYR